MDSAPAWYDNATGWAAECLRTVYRSHGQTTLEVHFAEPNKLPATQTKWILATANGRDISIMEYRGTA